MKAASKGHHHQRSTQLKRCHTKISSSIFCIKYDLYLDIIPDAVRFTKLKKNTGLDAAEAIVLQYMREDCESLFNGTLQSELYNA